MEDREMELQFAIAEFKQTVAECQKPLMAYIEKHDRLERNRNASAYLACSAREKAALDVVKDAIIVLGGGMVVLAALAFLMLR